MGEGGGGVGEGKRPRGGGGTGTGYNLVITLTVFLTHESPWHMEGNLGCYGSGLNNHQCHLQESSGLFKVPFAASIQGI